MTYVLEVNEMNGEKNYIMLLLLGFNYYYIKHTT